MSKKTTKKMLIRFGTKFDSHRIGWIEVMSKRRRDLREIGRFITGNPELELNPKCVKKIKVTRV